MQSVKITNFSLLVALIFFFSIFTSCKSLLSFAPPYVLDSTEINMEADNGNAGILVDFFNTSKKDIKSVTFYATLCESSESEGTLDNDVFVEYIYHGYIASNTYEEICIPISLLLETEELDNYYVQKIYASKIIFEDKEEWNDTNGKRAF